MNLSALELFFNIVRFLYLSNKNKLLGQLKKKTIFRRIKLKKKNLNNKKNQPKVSCNPVSNKRKLKGFNSSQILKFSFQSFNYYKSIKLIFFMPNYASAKQLNISLPTQHLH